MKYYCPVCKKKHETAHDLTKHEGATMDCECGALLIVLKKGKVEDFNVEMNRRDSTWPKDGKNTGFIEFEE